MTILYGIKNCDSVKKAQKYLNNKGVDFEFHDFRQAGINAALVTSFIDELGLDKVINKRSTTWKQLSDEDKNSINQGDAHSKKLAIKLCLEHETLIKRPVLKHQNQLSIGFKASDYDQLF